MVNILIADDHDLVRETIGAYLARESDFEVWTVASLDAALSELSGLTPFDIGILDYKMPGMDGLRGLQTGIQCFPGVHFALMSGIATAAVARSAMDIGASGYFPKSLSARTMVNAIRLVLSGDKYFPFDALDEADALESSDNGFGLTRREREALSFLCQGVSNKEIARAMGLQEVTVKLHVKNIFAKLQAKNRTQAALIAQKEGLI